MRIILMITLAMALSGCAPHIKKENMIPDLTYSELKISPRLKKNISINEITGGANTGALWQTQVSNEDFEEAY